jgi:hypothetical protein
LTLRFLHFALKGQPHHSAGQRPGKKTAKYNFRALKGRHKLSLARATRANCRALSGLVVHVKRVPRALPWAVMWLPFQGEMPKAEARLVPTTAQIPGHFPIRRTRTLAISASVMGLEAGFSAFGATFFGKIGEKMSFDVENGVFSGMFSAFPPVESARSLGCRP